jgi:simple sugar transport system ATP-binding protein
MEVADRIEVMWRGRRVVTYRKEETSMEQLVAAMTGATAREAS